MGGVHLGSENANSSRGVQGHAPPGKILENLECLGLHFTHNFDGGQREK